jgi:hypothetical protein
MRLELWFSPRADYPNCHNGSVSLVGNVNVCGSLLGFLQAETESVAMLGTGVTVSSSPLDGQGAVSRLYTRKTDESVDGLTQSRVLEVDNNYSGYGI